MRWWRASRVEPTLCILLLYPGILRGMASFALIGVAGFVAPRHLRAIRETGHELVAAVDPRDSVGVLDIYFPEAHFFTEFERFDRHVDKLRRKGAAQRIDWISICSPNYLHDAHVRFALRSGANALCEKPLVLNPWNLDGLREIERETGNRVCCVLQLRLHPALAALRERIAASGRRDHEVTLVYITPRGRWYHNSWKGDEARSGGLATNIGVHFFDLLIWLFGAPEASSVGLREPGRIAGDLVLERARVRWYLSVEGADCARLGRARGPFRRLEIDGEAVDFTDGFVDLHTETYRHALDRGGFGIDAVEPSIALVHAIRCAPVDDSASPGNWPWTP
jgi:UDP-N-acetyl-2-amino-2-deoxyglucuronate dehydrogenase